MCDHCEKSVPIDTEVDGDAVLQVRVDDPEYPAMFLLDVLRVGEVVFSFEVPRCPVCGSTPQRVGDCKLGGWTKDNLH